MQNTGTKTVGRYGNRVYAKHEDPEGGADTATIEKAETEAMQNMGTQGGRHGNNRESGN